MKLLNICNKAIEYSFYLLFFLVPLAFTSDTSELFEFNKLWVTFIITVVIGFFWITKMIIKKEFRLQKTPLDIPIALFLISEVISTLFSLDTHTSLWGYYSRFNGGLFSILAYIFLYYAFVTNLKDEEARQGEKEHFEFKKIYLFLTGVVIFFVGALVASQIKSVDAAGIPYQMLATLVTSLISFAVLMKAAPKGIFKRSLYAILSSTFLVVLWGLPSHFGYDPTCLLFRGTFDVACWTNDFQPKIRMFSTLGQPDWLGAYLAVLLPIIAALFINFYSEKKIVISAKLSTLKSHNFLIATSLFVFFVLSYLSLLYTQSRSAIAAFWIVIVALILYYLFFYVKPNFDKTKLNLDFKLAATIFLTVGVVTFVAGQPFGVLEKFTLTGIQRFLSKPAASKPAPATAAPVQPAAPTTELGGTDSGKIRLYVWEGALSIWKNNPIFGSGLETFAFAYYQYRPAAHNLTSEWNFLYNKAHNEYLNYLATTGTVGIVTYLFMIGTFLFFSVKFLYKKRGRPSREEFLIAAILAGYVSILMTNFFGFSVVMINILFYIIPAFVFMLSGLLDYEKAYTFTFSKKQGYNLNVAGKVSVGIAGLITLYLLFTLVNFWNADRDYYFGSNFDIAGDYERAYTFLKQAVDKRPSEPTFRNELAYNNAVLGASILAQNLQSTQSAQQNTQIAQELIQAAISNINQVTTEHPNNIVFWKTKVRVLYTLGQIDPSTYFPLALTAIKKSATLAPTDADISYNLGVLYGQTGDINDAISTLQNTIKLKPDYQGGKAYYALAIFYHAASVDQKGKVINPSYNQQAIDELNLMIKLFGPNQQAQDALAAWQKK